MNFVHDQLATGLKLWVLTIDDTFSRLSPAVGPASTSTVLTLLRRSMDWVNTRGKSIPDTGRPDSTIAMNSHLR
jgi:hypothetical protein